MKSTISVLALVLSLIACNNKEQCVQRTTDGPWAHVGKEMPSESVIAQEFESGGEQALAELLGAPLSKTVEETMWVYESRREAVHMWCDPVEKVVKHDQVFTIVRLRSLQGEKTCEIEGKEFISEHLISTDAAIQKARTPLGFKLRICGAAEQ